MLRLALQLDLPSLRLALARARSASLFGPLSNPRCLTLRLRLARSPARSASFSGSLSGSLWLALRARSASLAGSLSGSLWLKINPEVTPKSNKKLILKNNMINITTKILWTLSYNGKLQPYGETRFPARVVWSVATMCIYIYIYIYIYISNQNQERAICLQIGLWLYGYYTETIRIQN